MTVGSSVHNQRDMHRCVTQLYYKLFYHLQYEGFLDTLKEKHLYALHAEYLPATDSEVIDRVQGRLE